MILLMLPGVLAGFGPQCTTIPGIDFQGNDIAPVRSTPAPDGPACCALCLNRTGCVAWTLQTAAGNPACPQNCCYLKTSAAGRRSFKGAISGTTGHPPPPPPPRPSDGSCKDPTDCSLGGLCVGGKCACDPAFTGPNCVALNLGLATRGSAWNTKDTASWGGNVVWDTADSKWHLFFAEFVEHCGLGSWGTNSQVSHAVADQPAGPYTKVGAVQPPFHHNPTVAYDNSSGTCATVEADICQRVRISIELAVYVRQAECIISAVFMQSLGQGEALFIKCSKVVGSATPLTVQLAHD